MRTAKMVFITLSILIFSSCQKREIRIERYKSHIKIDKAEDFNSFIKEFYSDSLFQINRIVFPLESDKKIKKEYDEAIGKIKVMKAENSNYYPHNKGNWLYLRHKYFKGKDTVCLIDNVKYKRITNKTNQFVEEKILLYDSEQVMIIIKFQLIHNKWFLIDYLDEFENE